MSLVLNIKPTRSGSETRRRDKRLLVRLDADELAKVSAGAEAAGLTLASYAREKILSAPDRKPSRRARPDAALLAQVLAQLGRVGSNLNQIARALNSGDRRLIGELQASGKVIQGLAFLTMRALGFQPNADHY